MKNLIEVEVKSVVVISTQEGYSASLCGYT
jgi:hypothetical protein